jgi:hypothetical protein
VQSVVVVVVVYACVMVVMMMILVGAVVVVGVMTGVVVVVVAPLTIFDLINRQLLFLALSRERERGGSHRPHNIYRDTHPHTRACDCQVLSARPLLKMLVQSQRDAIRQLRTARITLCSSYVFAYVTSRASSSRAALHTTLHAQTRPGTRPTSWPRSMHHCIALATAAWKSLDKQ